MVFWGRSFIATRRRMRAIWLSRPGRLRPLNSREAWEAAIGFTGVVYFEPAVRRSVSLDQLRWISIQPLMVAHKVLHNLGRLGRVKFQSLMSYVRSQPTLPAPPPRENVTDDGGSLDGTVRHQQMSETSGNSAYQGSILDGQMPGEDAQLFQVTDEKADSGNNSNQQPEATTQEEYEKARDEARFEMTTRNDVTITGVSPSFYQIPGRGAYSVFDSGFIMHAPDGRYVRFPPGSSIEQYLSGTVIIKDPSGRVHTEYRPS